MTRLAPPVLLAALCAGAGCASRAPAVVDRPERAVPVDEAAPAPTETAPIDEPAEVPGIVHVVRAGETLYGIARTYGTSVERLATANDLEDPSRLRVGQRVFVPDAVPEPPLAAGPTAEGWDLQWPVAGGSVLSGFGAPRGNRRHAGIDIVGRHGQPVLAVEAGRVSYTGDSMRGYGLTVVIEHGNGLQSLYAHNSKLMVREGEHVLRGQAIARVGRSGNATTDHCHLEIRQHDVPRDPLLFVARHAGRR